MARRLDQEALRGPGPLLLRAVVVVGLVVDGEDRDPPVVVLLERFSRVAPDLGQALADVLLLEQHAAGVDPGGDQLTVEHLEHAVRAVL